MASDDKTVGQQMTTEDGSSVHFVSRSDAGGEATLMIESMNGSHLPISVTFFRSTMSQFFELADSAHIDAFNSSIFLP